ncbi:MAG TPA: hypothetical protein VK206_17630 [Anaerolineales bacterium]|nr:hypothetical protein [Anaerolineales bacterium]
MTSAIMAFLHHLAAFALTGTLIFELVTFRIALILFSAAMMARGVGMM